MDVQEVRSRNAGVSLRRWAGDSRLSGVEGTLSNWAGRAGRRARSWAEGGARSGHLQRACSRMAVS